MLVVREHDIQIACVPCDHVALCCARAGTSNPCMLPPVNIAPVSHVANETCNSVPGWCPIVAVTMCTLPANLHATGRLAMFCRVGPTQGTRCRCCRVPAHAAAPGTLTPRVLHNFQHALPATCEDTSGGRVCTWRVCWHTMEACLRRRNCLSLFWRGIL